MKLTRRKLLHMNPKQEDVIADETNQEKVTADES